MILRRITQHVREQNWTAIAIDLVIVVLGVFLGIQFGNWNDDRSNHKREEIVLREIAADLRLDREELASGRDVARVRIAAANYALDQALGRSVTAIRVPTIDNPLITVADSLLVPDVLLPDALKTGSLWTSILTGYYPAPSTTAYDALVGSGELGLIRDEALVRDIQTYQLVLDGLNVTHAGTLRPMRDEAQRVGISLGLAPFGTVDEAEFLRLVSAHPELAATVEAQLGWAAIHIALLERIDQHAAALLETLEADTRP